MEYGNKINEMLGKKQYSNLKYDDKRDPEYEMHMKGVKRKRCSSCGWPGYVTSKYCSGCGKTLNLHLH